MYFPIKARVLEILRATDSHGLDADYVMNLLRREGFEELPIPGGFHLARSLIDEKLQQLEANNPSDHAEDMKVRADSSDE